METITKSISTPSAELAMPMRTEMLRVEAVSELAQLFKKPSATESKPAWMLAAVFFMIELP